MAEQKQTILVVDDDRGICDLLGRFFHEHGYNALLAKNGEEMMAQLAKQPVDLIILDIMMPGEDGMTLCRKLRAKSQVPIIMLTAISEEIERILGLEMGADDYLSKPFNPRELLARIKAILRRSGQTDGVAEQQDHVVYRFHTWELDKTARQLKTPDDLEISLSSGEYMLLLAFLERPQQVLSRDRLLDLTRNRSAAPFDRSIDIQISRLRSKIEDDPKNPQLIKTIRGGGYILATSVERC
ncbi:MAG: response regulator [Coxiellaceae bacterium]|nr:response regulator [Coxiellaceae bacterium]